MSHTRHFISWLIVILFIFVSLGCGSGGGGGGGSDDPPATDDDSGDDGDSGGVSTQTSLTGDWIFVDGDSASAGINHDSSENAETPHAISYASKLYVAWVEDYYISPSRYSQIRVAELDNTNWSFVDGNSGTGLNVNSDKNASHPELASDSGGLYVTWEEDSTIYVHEWDDNTSWVQIGSSLEDDYNANSSSIEFHSGNLFATWSEAAGDYNNIRVKEWNGESWSAIDSSGDSRLINYNPNATGNTPFLISYDSKLICIWSEKEDSSSDQVRVKQWSGTGTNWNFIDDSNDYTGLNYDTTRSGKFPHAVVFNSKLYVTWQESNQIRVKEWDGTHWSFVDGNQAIGINHDASWDAANPRLAVYNSKLYATWDEAPAREQVIAPNMIINSSTFEPMDTLPQPVPVGNKQIRVKVWNGGDEWSSVDGGGTTGINKSSENDAENPFLVEYDSELYNVWQEYDSESIYQIRAARADEN